MSSVEAQRPTPSHAASNTTESRASVGELLSEVSQDISTLMRQEVALAKAEVRQSAMRGAKGAGMFAGAGYAGHFVVIFLSVAAWWAIGDSTGHGWSALIVAGIWLLIAAVLAVMGRAQLKAIKGIPQTTETLKKIPDAAKGNEETA